MCWDMNRRSAEKRIICSCVSPPLPRQPVVGRNERARSWRIPKTEGNSSKTQKPSQIAQETGEPSGESVYARGSKSLQRNVVAKAEQLAGPLDVRVLLNHKAMMTWLGLSLFATLLMLACFTTHPVWSWTAFERISHTA